MNSLFPGYQIESRLHEGEKTVIYCGIQQPQNTRVVIKTLQAEYPSLEEITRLRHEYKILRDLQIEGVAKPIEAIAHGHKLALILEYFTGQSLKEWLADNPVDLPEFFSIAIQLASILAKLHQNHVIHKDIKPQNILINPTTLQIRLIDFSISSRLSRENPTLSNPELLEGTLAYLSPEQTGRMNRCIDYRTDFYSTGITFYEMLCGQLPFSTTDLLELVHHHIAKKPIPPHQLNPKIPPALSQIVMKLLAKTAEERYQSARGLLADLETCRDRLADATFLESFIPGTRDNSGQFLLPQKLYGRETEVAQILDAFARISGKNSSEISAEASPNRSEIMLVSGYSGIGKTSVINEVHKPIVAARGYFIAGKFDQFKRNIPYASLIQAFDSLIEYILTETSSKIARWKEKILNAIGENGQVIIDVIPQLERIIGTQPLVPTLGPTESQNRFNRVFQNFIRVFAQSDHPLVIFLDDLQWADSATLKLLELLMSDRHSQYLLMIGAYRDNEVSPTHPTIQTLDRLQKSGAVINNIVLQPLARSDIEQFLADTLTQPSEFRQPEDVESQPIHRLAELLFNKTGGNPFFLTQLLQTLYEENLLQFNFNIGTWEWDIQEIQSLGITDYNVVELIARNLQKLPAATQQILQLAACIGNPFNLDVLALAKRSLEPDAETSAGDTAVELWDALQAGLVLPLSNNYKMPLVWDDGTRETEDAIALISSSAHRKSEETISYKFLHDRVQQAAYSLIPTNQRIQTHCKIGKLLLDSTPEEQLPERIFDIVNQLDIGIEAIDSREEKHRLAELNLMAGKKAKAATAYDSAANYLNIALDLLPATSWETDYELTRDIYTEAVEAQYLNTDFDRAQQLAEVVLQQGKDLLEKLKIYETQIQFYIAQNQIKSAMEIGLRVLKQLGVDLPENPSKLDILAALVATKLNRGRKAIADFEELPPMNDPYKIAAMRILSVLLVPAFLICPNLFPIVTFKMVNLAIKYGNSAFAAYGYALYGWILCGVLSDIEAGYQFGQLACQLTEKYENRELNVKIYSVFNAFIRPWKEPIQHSLQPFIEALNRSLETGTLDYTGHSAINYCSYMFLAGKHLEEVSLKCHDYLALLEKIQQQNAIEIVKIIENIAVKLQQRDSVEKKGIWGDESQEAALFQELENTQMLQALFYGYLGAEIFAYLFADVPGAIAYGKQAENYTTSMLGVVSVAVHNFYYSLALLARYPKVSKGDRRQILKQVARQQKQLKRWAKHAPENYQHKYQLVEAEKARVLGQDARAIALYDRAITGAKEQGYIPEAAIANERFAEFHFSRQQDNQARFYLTEAYYGYIRWGASAKVAALESKYPQIFSQLRSQTSTRTPSCDRTVHLTRTTTSTASVSAVMDLSAAISASQAISSEIVLDRLLLKLMHILMENAGADKGFILLSKSGQLVIEAAGDIESQQYQRLPSIPVETSAELPQAIVNYIDRTREAIAIDNPQLDNRFARDPYIAQHQPPSVLGLPLIHHGKFIGILYLENHLSPGAFTRERLNVLNLLAAQVAISLDNAALYQELQGYSIQLERKNADLRASEAREREKATQLETALRDLQQTQAQLIQTEKISSLGQLVAGVAHEVNNPVGFIAGNLTIASESVSDLIDLLHLYRHYFPEPPAKIQEKIEEIDLDFLVADLPQMLSSMTMGTDRIREIMQSLRNFSRVDAEKPKPANLHAGLDSTLMILSSRLKAKGTRKAIVTVKEYGELPKVSCFPGQLNQVFMNLIANAIDALEEPRQIREKEIRIRTEVIVDSSSSLPYAQIRIKDNGPGMFETVRQQLFDPFFTTKPEGKGTGLGLSISYQIVVEKHQGMLECISAPGEGAEFIISLPIKPH
ncbi:trifunctional serine/threonine-protein kinase/ATP-binding protein/sensor histidine kinase [Phormidium sp. CCY1219]|uniref:trifunctional serine/threonine-protein kinase/ATP-binding protein/sensor histidine kinase n=1 Tax=Phormidium sp. CCY1219 TaxID=2886104 RepID=UPI002D1F8284|nr:AAA family ATPase [Phormidium sp. CCY1219]MEB3830347.1 AAA family ATPase [Phormidium sp. CCY1219]